MQDRVRVALCIYGYDGEFSELTDKIGLQPTLLAESRDRGGHKNTIVRRWELSSGAPETSHPEVHLKELAKKLEGRHDAIREIASKYKTSIDMGIDYHQYNPEIVLDTKLLRAYADMGVEIWLDMYNHNDEAEDD
jgi:hypothetical protein